MGFGQAISACFTNYFDFKTRASRSEYWYFALFMVIAGVASAIIDLIVFGAKENIGPINGVFSLATIIPSISVSVRRLHDIGRTGWFLLLGLIPIVGWIVLIYWACQPSTPAPNQYGPSPA